MKSILLLLSAFLATQAFCSDEPTCKDLQGTESVDGKCLCDGQELAMLYETCFNGKIVPQGILSLTEAPAKGPKTVILDGYRYSLSGNYFVGKFADYAVCEAEVGVERVNDDRVLPGGAGPEGGRVGCFEKGGACPNPAECVKEDSAADYTSSLKKSLYKIVYARDHFQLFKDRSEVKAKKLW